VNAFRRTSFLPSLILAGWLLAGAPPPARAATNAALAGIGGVSNGTILNGDGTGAARITINSVPLALVKQARDASGAVLPDGGAVSPTQEIWFILHVDNPTAHAASDIRITDPLDETQFTYVPGSLEETTVPSGSSDAAIWAGTWSPLTDAPGGPDDAASAVDTGGPPGPDRVTAGAVPGQPNAPFVIPGGSLRAIRFRVTVN